MESIMSETTGLKPTDDVYLKSISCEPDEYGGFYATFDDGLDIQYEPRKKIFNPKKRTLRIHADPAKVDIAFFHNKFELGYNTENETGVWFSVHDEELYYHKDVISEITSELEYPWKKESDTNGI